MPRGKMKAALPKGSALNMLAELEADRLQLVDRERVAREEAAHELGRMVLSVGLSWPDLASLEDLLQRAKEIGMPAVLDRVGKRNGAQQTPRRMVELGSSVSGDSVREGIDAVA